MGKTKRGFNWRARSQISGSVDLSQAKLLEGKLEQNDALKSGPGGGFQVSCDEGTLIISISINDVCREAMLSSCQPRETNLEWTEMCPWWEKY